MLGVALHLEKLVINLKMDALKLWNIALVVQEILPVLSLRLAIANPFKTKQESQGTLEIPYEPPCYILQCS